LAWPSNDADLVILAGDIARPAQAIDWAGALGKPVLYVPGNHEFYGASLDGTLRDLKSLAAGSAVRVLDDDEVVIAGVRFLGSTLWTDFNLFGESGKAEAQDAALRFMRDYRRIFLDEQQQRIFTPQDSAALFERHAAWLAQRLAQPHDGPTVVITHHAPAPGSIHPRFAGSPINASFVSDARALLDGSRVQLWIHGHTHDSFDYRLNGTRVVCNPRGYAKDGVNENARFDPNFIAEVG
jgi:predicted phosphodiesterase